MITHLAAAAPVHHVTRPAQTGSAAGVGITLSLALVLGIIAVLFAMRGRTTKLAAFFWFAFGAAMAGGTVAGLALTLSGTGLTAVNSIIGSIHQ